MIRVKNLFCVDYTIFRRMVLDLFKNIFFFFALYLHFYAHPSVNLRSCSLLCNFQNTLPKIPGRIQHLMSVSGRALFPGTVHLSCMSGICAYLFT
jgi:hypothetical protein